MDTFYNNYAEIYLGTFDSESLAFDGGSLDDLDFLEGGDYYDSEMYSTFKYLDYSGAFVSGG